ncbi:group II intron reverse transcriptase/maturase [Candidatus Poribacteria bacterium]|nr:group II intron reverse transcriptase/maturase [Candidatus Poribacteria bacterium]
METKLKLITERAKRDPDCKFTTLAYLLNEGYLLECFKELKRNKAPGIDGVTVEEYERNLSENIKELVKRLKGKRYRPQPVRRTYIPKDAKSLRPLGIPTIEDKMVQMGIKRILDAIWEVAFLDVSYGFRPNRGCHDALDEVKEVIVTRPVNYVVDMDIEKFFDTVDHAWIMQFLEHRIGDPSFLRLIVRFLKAGVMEEGRYMEVEKGTPQGGLISPVLANIYLHYVLDLWLEKKVKRQGKGFAHMTRYADDFIVCFQCEDEAQKFAGELKERFGKFGLKISEAKSRTIEFGRKAWHKEQTEEIKAGTFDFLGLTHYCTKTRKGRFKVGRKTSKKKLRQKLKAMNEWLKRIRNAEKWTKWWETLKRKLVGHYRYYGVSGNIEGLEQFYGKATRLAYKWMNRRSQRKSITWEKFNKILVWNPLPKPKIYHSPYCPSST